jgi:hypothetical protein
MLPRPASRTPGASAMKHANVAGYSAEYGFAAQSFLSQVTPGEILGRDIHGIIEDSAGPQLFIRCKNAKGFWPL